jgi:hypothetical protein
MRKRNVTTFGGVRPSITIIITLLCMASFGFAQEDGVNSPELASLRQNYESEIVRVTERIRANYITQLDRLQKSLAINGNLDVALAVRKEKEKISQIPTPAQLAQMQAITGLEIIKATYGSDSKKVDVTHVVKDLQGKEASGRLLVPVAFREDPDFGVGKKLVVTYRFNGKETTATASEKDYLLLPDGNTGQVMVK